MVKPIFIHVAKTGGTAIVTAYKGYLVNYGHSTAVDTMAKVGVTDYINAFSFAFVRNPWDRLVSWFKYSTDTSKQGMVVPPGTPKTFTEWCLESDRPTKLFNAPNRSVERMLTNLQGDVVVDRVFRYEEYAEARYQIDKVLGVWPPNVRVNESPGYPFPITHWRDYYCSQTRAMVEDLAAWEIVRFGYKFRG